MSQRRLGGAANAARRVLGGRAARGSAGADAVADEGYTECGCGCGVAMFSNCVCVCLDLSMYFYTQ